MDLQNAGHDVAAGNEYVANPLIEADIALVFSFDLFVQRFRATSNFQTKTNSRATRN